MQINPRIGFLILLVGVILCAGYWWLFSPTMPAQIEPASATSAVLIAAQPHFTLTMPSGWSLETLNGNALHNRQTTSDPTSQPAFSQFLQTVDPNSTVFLARQNTAPALAATVIAFALPRNALQLSTILSATAQTVAATPGITLGAAGMVPTMRTDGQPYAQIQYSIANAIGEKEWVEFAALLNPEADEITVLILIAPQQQEAAQDAFTWMIEQIVFL